MATRTELLALRAQITQATEGHDLLSDKRAQLLESFREVANTVLERGDALAESASHAQRALAWADAIDGPEAVASTGLAVSEEIVLQARPRTVMGVRFAEIERAPIGRARHERGYSLPGSSAHIDAAAEGYEDQLDLVVKIAAEELRLRRLADELQKVSRRLNALEHVVIPRLTQQLRQTRAVLEERDREDHFRLLRVKRRRAGSP